MIARPRPVLRPCEGLTALETAAVLLITAIVAVPLLAIATRIVALPVEWQANMEATRDAREVLRQVADDARQASCVRQFGIEEDPEASSTHWTFTWMDYLKEKYFVVEYHVEDDVVVREVHSESFSNVMHSDARCSTIGVLFGPPRRMGPVAHFDIRFTPVPVDGTDDRCIVNARVKPSRPEDAPIQEIAAMMRPDNAQCEHPPQ